VRVLWCRVIARCLGLLERCLSGIAVAWIALQPSWAQEANTTDLRGTVGGTQAWQISPSLSVSEHYSDNVSLSPAGLERKEWTTRLRPAVSISHNSSRLHLGVTYAPELLYRANQGATDISHFLNAIGNAELWSRTFFVDLSAGVSQQNTSLLGQQADSNLNTTTNRVTVRRYSISPYISHEFGVAAIGEIRLTTDSVRFGRDGASRTPRGLGGASRRRGGRWRTTAAGRRWTSGRWPLP